jgi:hypothetical protein
VRRTAVTDYEDELEDDIDAEGRNATQRRMDEDADTDGDGPVDVEWEEDDTA